MKRVETNIEEQILTEAEVGAFFSGQRVYLRPIPPSSDDESDDDHDVEDYCRRIT